MRTYSDTEAHAIFARAAGRQQDVREADERARFGLTLAELQAVGAEAGIEPAHVAAAARALDVGEPGAVRTVLGVPDRVHVTRALPVPLGDAGWTALVDALRQSFGQEGRVEHLGARRTWSAPDVVLSTRATVRVEPGAGDDVVTFEEPLAPFSTLGAPLVPLALTVFFWLGSFQPGVPIVFALLTLATALAVRLGLPAWGRVQTRRFDAAVDATELALLRAHREAAAERNAAPTLTLDLDGLTDPLAGPSRPRDGRRRTGG